MKKIAYLLTILMVTFSLFTACESSLQEEVFTQLGPSNFFKSEQDAFALLNSAYAVDQQQFGGRNYLLLAELPTDILIERSGGLRRLAQPIEDFTWDATHSFFSNAWNDAYRAINRANVAIDNIPDIDMNESLKQRLIGEAQFIRASSYSYLYNYFGPTPLETSSDVDLSDKPSRASEEKFKKFVTDELRASSEILPEQADQYGRATKGTALAVLCKFHLNNKQWQEAADVAKEIMDSGTYALFDGAKRTDLFKVENERNSEFIYVRPHLPQSGLGNSYLAHAAPPDYKFKFPPKENFAAQYKTLSKFLNSFPPGDQRKEAIITEYEDTNGNIVQLEEDDARSFKFQEDPNGTGRTLGNDEPVIRYADILLTRAEALNELDGPTQESINLINMVREKAGVDPLNLADFSSKASLRDAILDERGWEFFTEALRREDLIRHGKFIELAKQRGKTAFDYQVRYPIPQSEIDKNPNLEQNEGY